MKTTKVIIPRSGPPRAIYDSFTAGAFGKLGAVQIDRASHVETWLSLSEFAQGCLVWDGVVVYDTEGPRLTKPITGEYAALYRDFLALFWADMTPCDGGVHGPFADKDTALQFEHDWLEVHGIPLTDKLKKATDDS